MARGLEKFKNSMEDNIEAMDSIMTIFDTELYVVEHILLSLGHCYYYDYKNERVIDGILSMVATEVGDIKIYFKTGKISTPLDPLDVFMYIGKTEDDIATYTEK